MVFWFCGERKGGRKGEGPAAAARVCLNSPNTSANTAVALEGGGNPAGGATGEGRSWGLRVSGCGKAGMAAGWDGMLPGVGTALPAGQDVGRQSP